MYSIFVESIIVGWVVFYWEDERLFRTKVSLQVYEGAIMTEKQ